MKNLALVFSLLVLSPGLFAQNSTAISPADAQALLKKDPKVILLDVRTGQEFAQGHIPGAKLLPFDTIREGTASGLIKDKTTPVIVYCQSGRRSALALKTLQSLGYSSVRDLGGIRNWPFEVVKEK